MTNGMDEKFIPLKNGEQAHCGICKYCRVLYKCLKVPCPANYKAEKSLCCVLEDTIREINKKNFCDDFKRREYDEMKL